MQQHLLKSADDAVVIFGSSFPNDQEYTHVSSAGNEDGDGDGVIFKFCYLRDANSNTVHYGVKKMAAQDN